LSVPPFDPADVTLNEHQRRHFAVVLTLLEESLAEIERVGTNTRGGAGSLMEYADDLPPGFAAQVGPRIAMLRKLIAGLVASLALEPGVTSRRSVVRALAAGEAVRIEDSDAKQMRGFGAVDPRFGATIQPVLDAMHVELRAIARLAAGKNVG
jgi:hypothetical protein